MIYCWTVFGLLEMSSATCESGEKKSESCASEQMYAVMEAAATSSDIELMRSL